MVVLVDIWGGPVSNVYMVVPDADLVITSEFLDSEPWANASLEQQMASLLTATRQIDSYNWVGDKYFYNQLLQFPRTPIEGTPTGPYGAGFADAGWVATADQDEYLRRQRIRVRRACALQANFMLRLHQGRIPEREAQFTGVASRSRSAAGVSNSQSYSYFSHRLGPEALDELRYYRGAPRLLRATIRSTPD